MKIFISVSMAFIFSSCGLNVDNIKNDKSALNIVNGVELKNDVTTIGLATVYLINQSNESFCSGVLIDGYTVITAAHCLTSLFPNSFSVMFSNNGQHKSIKNYNFIVHPKYGTTKETADYDIALLRLERDAVKDGLGNIAKIDFDNNIKLKKQDNVIIAGYGETKNINQPKGILRTITSKIISPVNDKNMFFSVKGLKENQTVCFGDSGGPAYYLKNNTYFVVGTIINTRNNCEGINDITHIHYYKTWIKKETIKLATSEVKNIGMTLGSVVLSNKARIKTIRCRDISKKNQNIFLCDIVTPYGTEYNDSVCTWDKAIEKYLCKVPETLPNNIK